jgi:hypothetical protein
METGLDMRHLQPSAKTATQDSSLVMRLGQRFESARRLFVLCRLAGKTQRTTMVSALGWNRFTSTYPPEVLSMTLTVYLRMRESARPRPF